MQFHLLRFLPVSIAVQGVDEKVERPAEEPCSDGQQRPSQDTVLSDLEIAAVATIPQDDSLEMPRLPALPAAIVHPVHQGWGEQGGNEQCHHEIDNDHPGKVIEVVLDIVGQPVNDNQGSDRGEHRPDDTEISLEIAVIAIMVDHHDGRIDDQP